MQQVLAFRLYPAPTGERFYAEDLATEQQVKQLFDACQILEAAIFAAGWCYLLQHHGLETLYRINQISDWFGVTSLAEYREALSAHFAELQYDVPREYLR